MPETAVSPDNPLKRDFKPEHNPFIDTEALEKNSDWDKALDGRRNSACDTSYPEDTDAAMIMSWITQKPSSEASKKANRVINDTIGAEDETIFRLGVDVVTRQSMNRLGPGNWLNDEVMNFFTILLMRQEEEMCRRDVSRERSCIFKTSFINLMCRGGVYGYENVETWYKSIPGKSRSCQPVLFSIILPY